MNNDHRLLLRNYHSHDLEFVYELPYDSNNNPYFLMNFSPTFIFSHISDDLCLQLYNSTDRLDIHFSHVIDQS